MLIATAEISYSSCCKNECRRAQYTIRTLLTWKIALCHYQCCCLHDRYCHDMVNPSCHDLHGMNKASCHEKWHGQLFLSWPMAKAMLSYRTNGIVNSCQVRRHCQCLPLLAQRFPVMTDFVSNKCCRNVVNLVVIKRKLGKDRLKDSVLRISNFNCLKPHTWRKRRSSSSS